MNKLTALILTMALALSIAFPANACRADWNGMREALPQHTSSTAHSNREECAEKWMGGPPSPEGKVENEADESETLTTEEMIAINHDQSDPRWFDIPDCQHTNTTIWRCWSPDDGDTYEEECNDCGEIIAEWPVEEEEPCPHTDTTEYECCDQHGHRIDVVCVECGEVVDCWKLPEDDPNDYPTLEEDYIPDSEAWVEEGEEVEEE